MYDQHNEINQQHLPTGELNEVIFQRVLEHVPEWARSVTSLDQVAIRRLSGMSNACYRIVLRQGVILEDRETARDFLYRKFTCAVVDSEAEAIVFKCMSDSGQGPALVYQSSSYRIEHFIQGRPISIWEMRSPVIMESVVHAVFEMHTRSGICEAFQTIRPRQDNQMGVEIAIEEWGPACLKRMTSIRAKLDIEQNVGHRKISDALDRLEHTYLREGYQEWMRSFIPSGKAVITHSDVQENNILLRFGDSKVCLIDYEYGMWNPPMYDLANYLNEWCCDNAYPTGNGIAHFLQNWPTEEEIVSLTRHYYLLENNGAVWSIDNEICQQKVLEVKQCMVLNLFYVACWCIMTLKEEHETNPDVYNWDLIHGKCDMQQLCQQKFGFSQC